MLLGHGFPQMSHLLFVESWKWLQRMYVKLNRKDSWRSIRASLIFRINIRRTHKIKFLTPFRLPMLPITRSLTIINCVICAQAKSPLQIFLLYLSFKRLRPWSINQNETWGNFRPSFKYPLTSGTIHNRKSTNTGIGNISYEMIFNLDYQTRALLVSISNSLFKSEVVSSYWN